MAKCRSKRCTQVVKTGWSFCPNCGKDNRPNEFRPTILTCAHRFPNPKRYCTICGEGYGGAKAAAATAANIRFGTNLAVLGLLIVSGALYIKYTIGVGSGAGFQWIHSWYDTAVMFPGDIGVSGSEIPTYALIGGGFMLALGVLGVVAARSNKPAPVKKRKKKKLATTTAVSIESAPELTQVEASGCEEAMRPAFASSINIH